MIMLKIILGAIGGGLVVWAMITIIQLAWLRLKRPAPPLLTDLVARWAKEHQGDIQRYVAFGGDIRVGPIPVSPPARRPVIPTDKDWAGCTAELCDICQRKGQFPSCPWFSDIGKTKKVHPTKVWS